MRPEDAIRTLKQNDARLIKDLVIALDAARIQLRLTSNMIALAMPTSDAWSDVVNACNFQAGLADRTLLKAKNAGYDTK